MKFDRKHPDRGYLHERVEHCLCEAAFARRWENTMKGDTVTLNSIIGFNPTLRDRYVAASVIQWLGTNVGWGWLNHTFGESGWVLSGRTAYRPRALDEEEFERALRQANFDQQWLSDHAKLVRQAFQMLFDLSEPQ